MKQTLLLDLDGVCCSFDNNMRIWNLEHTGVWLPEPSSYYQYDALAKKYLSIPGIFRNMPLLENCYEVLYKHLPDYNYVVVTSRPPEHYSDTVEWVKEYLPPVDSIIFTDSGSKWRVRGDVIIDDNPEVITSCRTWLRVLTIKMNYSYNKRTRADYKVNNWSEIDELLEQLIV